MNILGLEAVTGYLKTLKSSVLILMRINAKGIARMHAEFMNSRRLYSPLDTNVTLPTHGSTLVVLPLRGTLNGQT